MRWCVSRVVCRVRLCVCVSCVARYFVEDRSKGLDPEFDGTPRFVIKRTFKWIRKLWGTVDRYLSYIGFTYAYVDLHRHLHLHHHHHLRL